MKGGREEMEGALNLNARVLGFSLSVGCPLGLSALVSDQEQAAMGGES